MAQYNDTIQEVLDFLDSHGMGYEIYTHPPLFTVEDGMKYWKEIDERHCDGSGPVHCKNLFLRNHKGNRHYLVSFDCHKTLDIHSLEHLLRQGKLCHSPLPRGCGAACGSSPVPCPCSV